MKQSSKVGKEFMIRAPGRINLLGEHVDYNGGVVMPAAINRYVSLKLTVMEERVIKLIAVDLNQTVSIPLDALEKKIDADGHALPSFALYPAGVAWALLKAGYEVNGIEAVYSSNIPIGSGLSSSAAIEVAFEKGWQVAGGWEIDPMKLALVCQQAENEYVGVRSGLMDQFASVFGVEGHALVFDTLSLNWETIKLPPYISIVLADSKIPRALSRSEYNERRRDCESALDKFRTKLHDVRSLSDVDKGQFETLSYLLNERQQKRVRFVIEEILRVKHGIETLKQGDIIQFGELMRECHYGLRDLYEVSCFELDALVTIASKLKGCLGARLTGAGFGGCTVNLVERDYVDDFIKNLSKDYHQITCKGVNVYVCQASNGVSVLEQA